MLELVVILSVIEIVLALAVLAAFLIAIMRSLRRSASLFAQIGFGVRAIDMQTRNIGPGVQEINRTLERTDALTRDLARRGERRS